MRPSAEVKYGKPGIVFTRSLNAPVRLAFDAWTAERQVATWWGPYGFTNPVCHWDAREGGGIYIDMTAPDGMVFPMTGTFLEMHPLSKIVFVSRAFEDEDGNAQLEVVNTVTFIGEGATTKMILEASVKKATPEVRESLDGMQQGWNQSLDKLEEFLQNKTAHDKQDH